MAQLAMTAARSMQNPTVIGKQPERVAHFHTRQGRSRVDLEPHQIVA
jgi:hypothetical protein